MKRCPQCEFLYEDEQSLCDMDGSPLACDAPLADVELQAPLNAEPKRKSTWRLFGILGIPAVVLGVLLPVAFQGSGQPLPEKAGPVLQNAKPEAPSPEISTSPAVPSPSPDIVPAEGNPSDPEKSITEHDNSNVQSIAKASANSVVRANQRAIGSSRARAGGLELVVVSSNRSGAFATQQVPARREATRPQVAARTAPKEEKKDSKLNSFLKKTGRVLKRPFKF